MARKGRAITHADLAPSRGITDLGSKTAVSLIVLTILCGLFCFVLCLMAESTRSQVTWVTSDGKKGGGESSSSKCVYSGSGKTPLLFVAIAFVTLAVAMVVKHMYLLIAVSKADPSSGFFALDPNSASVRIYTWQAGFFFLTTWICFAVAEILLLIALSVESGHLQDWSKPRPTCLVIREGLLSAAGVLSLTTVLLAGGLYLTALQLQRVSQEYKNAAREILGASAFYATPPRSPDRNGEMSTVERENPVREPHRDHIGQYSLFVYPTPSSKHLNVA